MKKIGNLNGDFEYELLDENQQDIDIRRKLAILYATPFTDILWWQLNEPSLKNNGYYKLFYYEQGVLKHIILFEYSTKAPKKIFVINKVFKISIENMENIGHILFNEFAKAKQIVFEIIYEPSPKPSTKIIYERTSNDVIIMDLPNSMDDYMKSLGTSISKKVNYMKRRLTRDYPEYKVHYLENNEILFDHIEKIVSLNKNRMKFKGDVSLISESTCNALYQYASTSGFGFLCVCTINDQIIGGTINTIIGEHAYQHVIAHDDAYNPYSVGQLTMIHAIQYWIEKKNIKYFHLLWGTLDYKFHYGGIDHDLYNFRVFKNNNVYFFWGKTLRTCRVFYRTLKQKLQKNKTFFSFYKRMNTMKMKIIIMGASKNSQKISPSC